MTKRDPFEVVGRAVLALAIFGGVAAVASFALYEWLELISLDTSVAMSLVSFGATAGSVVLGFALRRRSRLAHDGMFVGLATLGGWFLLVTYALGQDTP